MRFAHFLVWLAVALVLTVLPACNRSGSGKPKVAFVSNNPASFWEIAEAGCRKAEAEPDCGVEVIFRKPDSGEAAKQKQIIDALLNQGVKAIAISVINPDGQHEFLNEVADKVPLLAVDNDAPESKRVCYIGTNNYLAGREVGKLVKEAMPEGGSVAIFVGQLEALNARQRRQGVLDELADKPPLENINKFENAPDSGAYGKYKLHGTFTDQPEGESKCIKLAKTALDDLEKEKNICFVGLWAYNPPALLTAVTDKKRPDVKIVGFDENLATLDGIADGTIYATVVQDPFNFGYEAVKLMDALSRGDKSKVPAKGLQIVPHRIVTKDGGKDRVEVKKFRADLEAQTGKK
jgi:ribose transport system substrate-binding protein